jgi:hypothetical protein
LLRAKAAGALGIAADEVVEILHEFSLGEQGTVQRTIAEARVRGRGSRVAIEEKCRSPRVVPYNARRD